MYTDELAKHCRNLERQAVLGIEETGANMLFLVLGFLEFPDQRDSDRHFLAPLVCIPTSLERQGGVGHQKFLLKYTGEDISENLSLREKLRTDHGLKIPEPDFEADEFTPDAYVLSVARAVRNHPGFAVRRWASLCILNFTNMLLVRDLEPSNWPQDRKGHSLLDHPIVATLLGGGVGDQHSNTAGMSQYAIEQPPAADIPLVYDADSSQHRALADALIGRRNLVIEGPPGTGKSQTITNLIAASIGAGKKVLFVAEKMAALEVVRSRLRAAGLDAFILELHSNKTSKKSVLESLEQRERFTPDRSRELAGLLQQADRHKHELKEYCELLHSVTHNNMSLTLYDVMWRAERFRQRLSLNERELSQLDVVDATEISEGTLSRRVDALTHLSSQYSEIGGFGPESPFFGFYPDRLIPGDEARLQALFTSGGEFGATLASAVSAYNEFLQYRLRGVSRDQLRIELAELQSFMSSTEDGEYLRLLPRLFKYDASGRRVRSVLQELRNRQQTYHSLGPAAVAGLKSEEFANEERLARLRKLQDLAVGAGMRVAHDSTTERLLTKLRSELGLLSEAQTSIAEFCSRRSIPYDGSQRTIKLLCSLAAVVRTAPDEQLHVASPNLSRTGAVQAIETLDQQRRAWRDTENRLRVFFYTDALPDISDIWGAILTLREGDAWYRFMQRRWRAAKRLHRAVRRNKTSVRTTERLSELQELHAFMKSRAAWLQSPIWSQYLSGLAPDENATLDEHLTVARWFRDVRQILEQLAAEPFDPAAVNSGNIAGLRRQFAELERLLEDARQSGDAISASLPEVNARAGGKLPDIIQATRDLTAELEEQLPWLWDHAPEGATLDECIRACDAALRRRAIHSGMREIQFRDLLGDAFVGVETNVERAFAALEVGERILNLGISEPLRSVLFCDQPLAVARHAAGLLQPVIAGLSRLDQLECELSKWGGFDLKQFVSADRSGDLDSFMDAFCKRVCNAASNIHALVPWSVYLARRSEARDLELGQFCDLLEQGRIPPRDLSDAYGYCVFSTIVREAFRHRRSLNRFSGLRHSKIREEFRRVDKEIIKIRGKSIAAECCRAADPPQGTNGPRVDDKTESCLLHYLYPQHRPRVPVRKMVSRAGHAIQELKPCFMMGPQAVAQFLAPGGVRFDLVIMDEASQLRPEEAIGAIARGAQVVVVGDSKQLPPTTFFLRINQSDEDDSQYTSTDLESILDLCASHFRPPRTLRWHYRSRHHSLIAFSNHHFYRDNLIVFPSPYGQSSKLGVRAVYLRDAECSNQTNLKEARRVVDAIIEHIATRRDESLGVVTLNIKQRDLIAELLEERLKDSADGVAFRERWAKEEQPLFVKNLENVQGDERDAIIVSTTFGKAPGTDVVRQNFGPISRPGGWRRLNVLFTRARKSIALYTSLNPEDIVVDSTTPDGTRALRDYLEYARRGVLHAPEDLPADPDSDFEVAVIDMLSRNGFEVTPQLGVAGFRIDIAVKHPDHRGTYLAAVECDGAAYHSAESVRDRDRIRQEVLESLGWRGRIWRIWSTDWFRSPRAETERLLDFLQGLRASWKPEFSSHSSWSEEGQETIRVAEATAADNTTVSDILIDTNEREVAVGSFVQYVDLSCPLDPKAVLITPNITDVQTGQIAAYTPLAQALIGAVIGDEVTLRVAGQPPRILRITDIKSGAPYPSGDGRLALSGGA